MLNREEIATFIKEKKLIENYINLDTQLTPNGFDLTVQSIFEFDTAGAIDFSNKERQIPQGNEIIPRKEKEAEAFGWWHLLPGAYKIKSNETVRLPNDIIALAYTRTSLLRAGAFTLHGVWDAGFRGKSEFILVVDNPHGVRLKQNARIAQLVFFHIQETFHGYRGVYQHTQ
jgi:dUTP pyrophosphatase